ncbi:MAG TPA: type II toxin-antitoxin system VapC family toxin [Terriglobales bacterium]|nr:type II toxin-antitoxin system VapC family toxin [Terriglobales bacterium]
MIVLDTHVLLWAVADSKKLSRAADAAIRRSRQADGVAISAITLWELASLVARGRIRDYGTVENSVNRLIEGVTIKPITPEIAALATQFPNDYPHDPADRLIGATARAEGLALVTRDENIRKSPLLKTIW